MKQHIELLGKTATDRVTNFAGTVTTVSFDLFGCVQAVVTPNVDKDGKPCDGRWFDVNRLLIADHRHVMPVPDFSAKPAEHKHGPAEKPAGRRG